MRALITGGDDVNAAQGDGMTALHWAARHGDVELVKMLLAAGANVKATTRLGSYTPLLMASESGSAGAIEALLAAGADREGDDGERRDAADVRERLGQADAVEVAGRARRRRQRGRADPRRDAR